MQEKIVLTCLLAIPVAPSDEKSSRQLKKLYGPKEKEAFSVSPELKDILIGLLLGDLYAEKQKASKNARLQFKLFSILYGKNTQFLMGQSTYFIHSELPLRVVHDGYRFRHDGGGRSPCRTS
jgi:hypothetical protein